MAANASRESLPGASSPSTRETRCWTWLYRSTLMYCGTRMLPNRQTFPRSFRPRSTSMLCSALSFSSASNSRRNRSVSGRVVPEGAAVAEILRPPEDMIDDHAVQIEPELEFREGRVGVRGHRIEIANEFVRHVSNEAADISSRDARRVMFREDGPERRDRPVRLDCLAVRPQHAGTVRDDHLGIEAHEGPLRKPRRSGQALEDEGVRVVVPRGGEQRIGIEARIERDALHRAASSGIGRLLPNTTSAMRWAAAAGSGAWNT